MSNLCNIYIQIDAIFDTRLAALWEIDPALCDKVMANGYHERVIDNFSLLSKSVDHDTWLERYQHRTKDTLKQSRITYLTNALVEVMKVIEQTTLLDPAIDGSEIVINTHPYDLNEREIEVLKDLFSTHCLLTSGIRTISVPNKSLDLATLGRDYSVVVMYDYIEWLKNRSEEDLIKNKTPLTKFIVPALLETMPDRDTQRLFNNSFEAMFAETEKLFTPFYMLHYWDAKIFSINLGTQT